MMTLRRFNALYLTDNYFGFNDLFSLPSDLLLPTIALPVLIPFLFINCFSVRVIVISMMFGKCLEIFSVTI